MNGFDFTDWLDGILLFVSQWAGTTVPRIVGALAGLLACIVAIMRGWERELKATGLLGALLFGGLLLAVSIDTRILHSLTELSFLARIRLLLGLFSLLVMAVTFESIRISRLRERYALLWMATGGMVLLTALFPQMLHFLTVVLGVQYVTAVVGVVFVFLLLVAFHFSIALSGLEEDRAQIAQRCALLDLRVAALEERTGLVPIVRNVPELSGPAPGPAASPRRFLRGAEAASLSVILLALVSVLWVGLWTGQPMVGDEVTHYYMLKNQTETWPQPTFVAQIPNGWSDEPEERRYPHPNGWHYLGASLVRATGGGFWLVQFYQAAFWLQLLLVSYGWSRARGGGKSRASLLVTLVLASVPMNLLFSVTFYQDVPMAAQAVTAFYLVDTRRPLRGALFMALALWIKVTGIIFVPPFLVLAAYRLYRAAPGAPPRRSRLWRPAAVLVLACALIGSAVWTNGWMLATYANGAGYYPVERIERLLRGRPLEPGRPHPAAVSEKGANAARSVRAAGSVSRYEAEIIANHPGDLRRPANFLVYGGALIWLVLAGGALGLVRPRSDKIQPGASRRQSWPLAVGGFYVAATYLQLRTAPDARFFLPALPFLVLPLCEWCMRLPKSRWILIGATLLGLMQGAYVLDKANDLRRISPELESAIDYLGKNPPEPRKIFMYPEGNYRLFPVPHDWYLGYWLREFWRGNNDERLDLLRRYGIGAIVVKKHLVAGVDDNISDLGVYPTYFLRQIREDSRFIKLFENKGVVIFQVPRATSPAGASRRPESAP